MATVELRGTARLPAAGTERYAYLPFDVPLGTTAISVRYAYDEGNILDIGLFDPTIGPFPSATGFRGWSGSKRDSFFVATDAATPGYLPGPLPPGTWRIVLGLASVTPRGCDYLVAIDLDSNNRGNMPTPRRREPPARPGGWYRGDLQTHTHHSDANGSVEDLIKAATTRGLDFLAVTDHNTVSHHRRLAELTSQDLLLVPGEEVTSYYGHANVWGARDWIDFRLGKDDDPERLADIARVKGGLLSINHPKRLPSCIGCDWELPVPAGANCFEAWHGPWPHRNWEALRRYDELLRGGRRLTLVGGSDRHQPPWPDTDPEVLQVGSPTTWICVSELSVSGALDALRAGNAFVSEGPAGPQLTIEVGGARMGALVTAQDGDALAASAEVIGASGDRLIWRGERGVVREMRIDGQRFHDAWNWHAQGHFLRAEVVAEAARDALDAEVDRLARLGKLPKGTYGAALAAKPLVRALSNPVYIRPRG